MEAQTKHQLSSRSLASGGQSEAAPVEAAPHRSLALAEL